MTGFTESVVEDAALSWLELFGYAILHLLAPARTAAGGPDSMHDTLMQMDDERTREIV